MHLDTTELIGYVASALVVVSLAMTSVVKLRTISLAGSLAFVVYGVAIESIPIVVTNAAIAVLNVWFLRAELGGRRDLAASVVPADSPFLVDFIGYHLQDIHRFQPDFELPPADPDTVAMLLMRDGLPAGALIGMRDGTDLHVLLDHVITPYRDSQISAWLYGTGSTAFRRLGVERVLSAPGAESHNSYLERMGFHRAGDRYELVLPR
jgi:hypothetical protein